MKFQTIILCFLFFVAVNFYLLKITRAVRKDQLLMFLFLVPRYKIFQEQLFAAKVTSFHCKDIDPVHIKNVSCYLKAKRNTSGIVVAYYTFRNANHVMVHLQIFIRNSGGHFLPYLINLTFNECERGRLYKEGPKTIKTMIEIVTADKRLLTYTCPFNVRK